MFLMLVFLFSLLQKCTVCIWIHRWLQGWCKGHLLQSHSEASLNTRFLYEVTWYGHQQTLTLSFTAIWFQMITLTGGISSPFLCFLECMECWQNAEWGIDYKVQWMRCLLKRPRPTWHHRKLLPNSTFAPPQQNFAKPNLKVFAPQPKSVRNWLMRWLVTLDLSQDRSQWSSSSSWQKNLGKCNWLEAYGRILFF